MAGWGRPVGVSLSVDPTLARCLSILVEFPFLHKVFASSSPVRRRFRLDQVGHASVDTRLVLHPGVDLPGKQWVKLNRLLCGTARVGDTLKLWCEQACVLAETLYSRWSLTACYTRLLVAFLVFAAHMQQLGFGCKT